jgi:HEAT repeat protein
LSAWITPELLFSSLNNTAADQYLACFILATTDTFPEKFICTYLKNSNYNAEVAILLMHLCNEKHVILPLDVILAADTRLKNTRSTQFAQQSILTKDVLMQAFSHHQNREAALTLLIAHFRRTLSAFSVEALKYLADLLPATFLLELLADTNTKLRLCAIQIATAFKARAPYQRLLEILYDPSEKIEIRHAVIKTLGDLDDDISLDPLFKMATDANGKLQVQALEALQAVVKHSRKEVSPDFVFSFLDNPETTIVQEALQLLTAMIEQGQDLPIAPFLALLQSKDSLTCHYAAIALCKMGIQTPLQTILRILPTVSHQNQRSIVRAFQYLNDQAPLEIILANLDGHFAKVILCSLAVSTPQKIVAFPLEYHKQSHVREAMQWALQSMLKNGLDITSYIHITQAAIQDPEKQVRLAAYTTMGMGSQYFSSKQLLQAVTDEDTEVQHTALRALAAFGSRVPVEVILPLLSETELSQDALETLHQTHPEVLSNLAPQAEAILRLETLPAPFAARSYYRIAETIGSIEKATPDVLDMLVDLLEWPQWDVQEQAAKALGAIKRNIPDQGIRALMTLRRTAEKKSVRLAADTALGEILSVEQGMEEESK